MAVFERIPLVGIVNFFGVGFKGFVGGVNGNNGGAAKIALAFMQSAAVVKSEAAPLAAGWAEGRFGDKVFFPVYFGRSTIIKIPIFIGNFKIFLALLTGRHISPRLISSCNYNRISLVSQE